jgi:transcriptional regulator with XRE-family HTH domain
MVELRTLRGLSQAEFARQLGQARTTVYNWESGRNKPEDETLLLVCRVLRTSVSYLMGETDDPRPAPDWRKGQGPNSEAEARAADVAKRLREAAALLEASLADRME